MKRLRREFITLIEIMIVMFIIALITGVLAYNYRGSLEEGKIFKTNASIEKIETILNLAVAKSPELLNSLQSNWPEIIKESPLVQNPAHLLTDGWGYPYIVSVENNVIKVTSQGLAAHEESSKRSKR